MEMNRNKSEVARLLHQIDMEEVAMRTQKSVVPKWRLAALPLSIDELCALDCVMTNYLAYARRVIALSAERDVQLEMLQGLHQRIRQVLLAGAGEGMPIPFTLDELNALEMALLGFVSFVQEKIAQSKHRDHVIEGVQKLRQRLRQMR